MTVDHPIEQSPETLMEGRSAFQAALRQAFAVLAESDCREVWFSDCNFEQWPLSDPEILGQLSRWAFAHRRLTMLAADFETVARLHPRWVDWRRRWSHVVGCRVVDPADADSIPCLFLAPPRLGVQLVDTNRFRGSVAANPAEIVRMRLDLDAYLQRSHESFPATTLGL